MFRRLWCSAGLIVLALTPLWAEPALTMERVVSQALSSGPRASALALRTDVARGRLVQAGAFPNPRVGAELQTTGLNGLQWYGLTAAQELELGGKRAARVRAAEAELELADWQVADARRGLMLEVKSRFVTWLFASELEKLRRESVELSDRQLELARKRLELGDVAGVDVTWLGAERERRQAALELASGAALAARESLSALTGPLGQAGPPAGRLGREGPREALEELIVRALAERPDLLAAAAQTRSRACQVEVERSRAVSNLTLTGGLAYQDNSLGAEAFLPRGVVQGLEDRTWVISAGFEIPLPLNDTNQGNIEQSETLVRQAELEEEALRLEVRAQVAESYQRWQSARRARLRLTEEALPRARESLEIIERAYQLGNRSVLDLLLAQEAYLSLRLSQLEMARDEEQSLVALESALGQHLEDTP